MPSARRSSQPRDPTCVSCIAGKFCTTEPPGKPHSIYQCQSHLSCCILHPQFLFQSFLGGLHCAACGILVFLNFLVHLQARGIFNPWTEWNLGPPQWKGGQSLNRWPAREVHIPGSNSNHPLLASLLTFPSPVPVSLISCHNRFSFTGSFISPPQFQECCEEKLSRLIF